ncbi:MAG: AarF/ABC1/UbiB kinase family protein [Acidimicrobiia bacterium]|nr:AarF/ABC1/UbiB kinase family protein [Acidimicrobiia bacterium]
MPAFDPRTDELVFPLHLPVPPRRELRHRAWRVLRSTARHFLPLAVARARGEDLDEKAWAHPLRLTFEDLGGTYMKFGQMIGSSPGVFGDDVSAEFRSCLDTGPAVPFADVRRQVEIELGRPLEATFAVFGEVPMAAASIAVVHEARLHNGTRVAVKVLRPGIETSVACDLGLIGPLIEILARQIGAGFSGTLLQLVDGFREQVAEELDLRNELRAQRAYQRLLAAVDLDRIVVPDPHPEASGRTILTMDYLDGVPIDDLAAIASMGHDPVPLVDQMVRANFMTVLRNGIFHGDVHAGNLMLLRDGRLALIDWGILGRLDPTSWGMFRSMIEGALGREGAWERVADYMLQIYGNVFKAQLGMDEADLRDFMRATVEPMLTRPFGEVSLAEFMSAPQKELARSQGLETGGRGLVALWRKWRKMRSVNADMLDTGGLGSAGDRGMFLLTKQMMYFERYGKMFLGDMAILEDRDFFTAVLDADPIDPAEVA